MAEELVKAIAYLREEEALRIAKERLDDGENPHQILEDARNALEIVGKRFGRREYFLPDLIYSGEILKEITELVKPRLAKVSERKHLGKVIMGTVAGDIHYLGKDIVTFMLEVNGFEVHDLGIDVPAQRFVEKLEETKAVVLGLSGLLTLAFDSMKETVQAIKAAGLRDKVKIMIGGGQVDDKVRKYTGADAYGADAIAALALAREWIVGK